MNFLKSVTVALCLVFVNATFAHAEEAKAPVETTNSALKSEYKLTDEQIKSMADRGLVEKDMARVARLAEKSGKTLDEVMKMRLDSKMGWGRIAKELGVHPGEIGHAVSDLKHEKHAERKAEKMEKKAAREAAKAEKNANKKK